MEKQQADKKSEEELEARVKQLEEEHRREIKKLKEVKEKYVIKITQKEQTEYMVTEWLKETKAAYSSELDNLAAKNASLMSDNEILMQQVEALRKLKDKLKSMQAADDELNLNDVFISSKSLDVIKGDLL